MPNFKWPKNFDPKLIEGKTILMPLCIDSDKHDMDDLEELIQVINQYAKNNNTVQFKVQFVLVDTLYRHNAKFIKECKQSEENQVDDREVESFTRQTSDDWMLRNKSTLEKLNENLRRPLINWDHWMKDANEEKYLHFLQTVRALYEKDDLYKELVGRDHANRLKPRTEKIKCQPNTIRYRQLHDLLKYKLHHYIEEENAVFMLWVSLGFNFLIYPGPLSHSMSYLNRTRCEGLFHIRPKPVSQELQRTATGTLEAAASASSNGDNKHNKHEKEVKDKGGANSKNHKNGEHDSNTSTSTSSSEEPTLPVLLEATAAAAIKILIKNREAASGGKKLSEDEVFEVIANYTRRTAQQFFNQPSNPGNNRYGLFTLSPAISAASAQSSAAAATSSPIPVPPAQLSPAASSSGQLASLAVQVGSSPVLHAGSPIVVSRTPPKDTPNATTYAAHSSSGNVSTDTSPEKSGKSENHSPPGYQSLA